MSNARQQCAKLRLKDNSVGINWCRRLLWWSVVVEVTGVMHRAWSHWGEMQLNWVTRTTWTPS